MGDHNSTADWKGSIFTALCYILYKVTLSDVALIVTILVGITNLLINWPKVKPQLIAIYKKYFKRK